MTDITFGPFSIDASGARLIRNGAEVKLRPQAVCALKVLALHSGRYLGYDQMIAEAWAGTSVSKHTVDVTIGEVRRALAEYGTWIAHRPKAGYALEVPKSDELVRRGWHFWNRRTREGFERALDCFKHAASEGSTDFRAFLGQSTAYLALAVYGMRAPRDMYKGFLEAHERAVTLVGLTPELRSNRAAGLHMFEHRLAEAEAEFEETLRQDPANGTIYIRMTMLYATLGRLDAALELIEGALQVDPLMPTLAATEIVVRFWRREFDEAAAIGEKAIDLHPYLQLGRAFYAQALEYSGRVDEALAQYQIGSILSPDLPWLRALEGTCLLKKKRTKEAMTILEGLEQLRQSDYVDAYFMAVLRAALGQREEAFAELDRAVDENSAWLYAVDVDPKMDCFKSDRRFVRVREHVVGKAPAV